MASLQSYLATADDGGIQIHLYGAGTVHRGRDTVQVETAYPWDGRIELTVRSESADPWTLALRVPGWCTESTVDGAPTESTNGYVRLTRSWQGTTRVVLRFAMPVRRLAAHHRVDAVRGCVALVRGPLVFGLEQTDLPDGTVLEDIEMDPAAPIDTLEHGTGQPIPVTLHLSGITRDPDATDLYQSYRHPFAAEVSEPAPMELTAVPYFLWGNRDPGPMRVWIPVRQPTTDELTIRKVDR
jgi:DUF1680 family protein